MPLRLLCEHRGRHRAGAGFGRWALEGGCGMNRFSYARPTDVAEAVREVGSDPSARFIAGGTNLLDLMKYNVERPTRLVDITRLPLTTIDKAEGGGLRIGALVPNSDLAYDEAVTAKYPLLRDA